MLCMECFTSCKTFGLPLASGYPYYLYYSKIKAGELSKLQKQQKTPVSISVLADVLY